MIETFLVKRPAKHAGEVGLFPDSEMAAEDLALVSMFSELIVTLRSEKKIERLKYLWGLVHKVADNCDMFLDKDDAMEGFKLRCGYSKAVYDPHTRKIETKAKSLTRISDEQLRILTAKIQEVITKEVLPGITSAQLRNEIEEMIK